MRRQGFPKCIIRPMLRRSRWLLGIALLSVSCSWAQIITTAAGTTWLFQGNGKPAVNAPLGFLWGVVTDSANNVYVADGDNDIVVKISPAGILTVFAGNGLCGSSGDGGP